MRGRFLAEALDQDAAALAVGDEAGALRPGRALGKLARLAAGAAIMPAERGVLGPPGMAAPRPSRRLVGYVTLGAPPFAPPRRAFRTVALRTFRAVTLRTLPRAFRAVTLWALPRAVAFRALEAAAWLVALGALEAAAWLVTFRALGAAAGRAALGAMRAVAAPGRRWRRFVRRAHENRPGEIASRLGRDAVAELIAQHARLHLDDLAVLHLAELERTERHADEAVRLQPERFDHIAHLAVLALADRHCEPHIGALRAIEARLDRPVAHAVDGKALAQPVERSLVDLAMGAHAIAPEPAGRGQFEHAREPAVIGQQQQPFGRDVEPADGDEPRQRLGERSEDGRPPLRVRIRRHQPGRLVVQEQPGALALRQRLAVDDDAVLRGHVKRPARRSPRR